MSLLDKQFKSDDFSKYLIQSLTNRPEISAAALKELFDHNAVSVIAPRVNAIIQALSSKEAADSGAHNIGCEPVDSAGGNTVYSNLMHLKNLISDVNTDVAQKTLNGVVLSDAFLSNDNSDIKQRFAAHRDSLCEHFLIGATTGTPSLYLFNDEAHPWAAISAKPCLFFVKPHADCAASPTISLCGSDPMPIRPISPGSITATQMRMDGVYILLWYPGSGLYLLNPESKGHTHLAADVTNLTAALSGKSDTTHSHAGTYQPAGDYATNATLNTKVTDINKALAGKSDRHTHDYVSTSAYNAGMLGKADSGHTHDYVATSTYNAGMSGKADSGHSHSSFPSLSLSSGLGVDSSGLTNVVYSSSPTPPPPGNVTWGTIYIQFI